MAKPKQLKNNSTNSSSSKLLLIIKLHYLKKKCIFTFLYAASAGRIIISFSEMWKKDDTH